ncbi:pyruvate formate lyase-activating protein [Salinimicrobium tongyeongense]|jgi:pyruvate formate lyase activating enzyme|uniref:Pyruvate formate-lyase-activating enzyme n=1 Tax=Salinimicrobium tongyeongense TaxID=2809707 RepID=A0ABY6NU95_9FLAO|nr:pyruvate formate-lyase-activating protein [Salinimicrobium tongyeongense]UZH56477.1 pyruvate formate lyase-activating protein [Salinimicrobium tongyeongense]
MIKDGSLVKQEVAQLNAPDSEQLRVHSIESFGTHDGPGIRLVVFVQGCQFRCLYCANPDTMDVKGGHFLNIEEIVQRAIKQKPYFRNKGGVTVSGGEPLLQRAILKKLFERLHQEGINTVLDSNGRVIDQQAKDLLDVTDLLMLDVKHFNNEWHKKLTGLSNLSTFKIAEYRESTGKPMWLRYVLVPGWSDQEAHLHELGRHFKDYKTIERIEILPYHQLGVHKWEALGMEYKLKDVSPPNAETLENTAAVFRKYFREVRVN